jgi:hypothetical protein
MLLERAYANVVARTRMRRRVPIIGVMAVMALALAGASAHAQTPASRVTGEPGSLRVQPRRCPTVAPDQVRRRIVDLALQEWTFFGKRIAAPRDTSEDDLTDEERRRRRPRLPPEEAARFAPAIAGYWAVTPEGAWIVARQNERWNGEDGISARWNAPWSAAFISWVMCEAGLADAAQFQRAVAHHTYIDQALRARDGGAPQAMFIARDPGEAGIAPGDLLCASRRPVYRTLADRRRQLGVGARSHCDIVVDVDETRGVLRAVGGNVRGVVSMKTFPLLRETGRRPRADTGDATRPLFAHLQLRAAPANAD